MMKNEVYSISEDLLDNFFYRNFTNQLRKFGVSYYFWINVILIANLVYILAIFSKIDTYKGEKFDFMTQIKDPTITTLTFLNLTVYFTFIWLEYVFHKMHSNDILGFRNETIERVFLKQMDFSQI